MKSPLISIVIPIYNTEKYLPNAIESVLSQAFSDFELLLIDDGSTDSCGAIIDEYASRDVRVKAFHKFNGGTYTGYNMGIEKATGKYIIFASSDDLLDEKALEIIAEQANEYDYDIIFMNVATHSCDEEQNIIQKNIQCSIMDSRFKVIGKKENENNWIRFMQLGLTRNPGNAYKTSIMKKYRFRTDIYGADYLMNLTIADEITSTSCHPANLYHGFFYESIKELRFNISSGKYYSYEHDMFNEFFQRSKELFASWNILDFTRLMILSNARIDHLKVELSNIFAWNNTMTIFDKMTHVISYFDDIVVAACLITERRREVEEALLTTLNRLYKSISSQDGDNEIIHWAVKLIDVITLTTKPISRRVIEFQNLLFDEHNPQRLGLTFFNELCNASIDADNSVALLYFEIEEAVRMNIAKENYLGAAEKIELLFNSQYSTPEKYLLLGQNCYFCGFKDDAIHAINLGLAKFPEYKRLVDAELKLTNK